MKEWQSALNYICMEANNTEKCQTNETSTAARRIGLLDRNAGLLCAALSVTKTTRLYLESKLTC